MRYAKSAAVIVGSMLALGSASPAFADMNAENAAAGANGPNFSLNQGFEEALKEHPLEDAVLEESPIGIDGPQTDALKSTAQGLVTGKMTPHSGRNLLGGA